MFFRRRRAVKSWWFGSGLSISAGCILRSLGDCMYGIACVSFVGYLGSVYFVYFLEEKWFVVPYVWLVEIGLM